MLGLPRLLSGEPSHNAANPASGKLAAAFHFARHSLARGIDDAVLLLRKRSPGVLIGSIGTIAFDLAVLGVCFRAFGASPPLGVLVLAYLIGQLGGNLPIPGGIGGIDGGLIGTFVLCHQPLAATAAAVLVYHAISLWIPALLGSAAFMQLRNTLLRVAEPAAICKPLVEPIDPAGLAAAAGGSG